MDITTLDMKGQDYSNSLIKSTSAFEAIKRNNLKFFKFEKKIKIFCIVTFITIVGIFAYFLASNYYNPKNKIKAILRDSKYLTLDFTIQGPHDRIIKKLEDKRVKNYLKEVFYLYKAGFVKENNSVSKDDSIELDDISNLLYVGKAIVGDYNQSFEFIFDTGSADLWVPSSKCNDDCPSKTLYDSSKSKTYEEDGKEVVLTYGSGTVRGFFSKDIVKVGHISIPYKFVEVTSTYEFQGYESTPFDGIIGLGWKALSLGDTTPLVVEFKNQNKIEKALFSIYLSKTDKKKGYITIGGIEEALYEGDIVYEKLAQELYWKVKLNMKFGDIDLKDYTFIVDSGTSAIVVPEDLYNEIVAGLMVFKIPILPAYVTSCKNNKFPNIILESEANKYVLEPKDYIMPLNEIYETDFRELDDICILLIMPFSVDNTTIILGDVFMRKYFTVFDYDNERVGFAIAKDI